MKNVRALPLILLGCALLIFGLSPAVSGRSQADNKVYTPAEGSPERAAILVAVADAYKEGADHPAKFKVNYLKVHQRWAWIDVTPLNDAAEPVADPAPLLFYNDQGKWTAKDLNEVVTDVEGHDGPHEPSPKYIKALQAKYTGLPADIIPTSAHALDQIQTIRQQYATINKNVKRYKTVKRELSGYSLEGGELIAYLDGSKIMKIVASHFGEGGKAVEEYYYWDNQLIFVYRKDSNYDKPGSGKVVRTAENRFYFNNDHLIRWINESGKQVASSDTEYQENEKDYLKFSKEFTDGVRSKKTTIEGMQ